ncbi:hypothetical protein SDC9_181150 [bioreactor metagenome]|uniref:Uncharacterized protein n=1 Tax=bioreactor metagenome TaxID=1076179 RepID=A0A645H6F5_9ZZZZ
MLSHFSRSQSTAPVILAFKPSMKCSIAKLGLSQSVINHSLTVSQLAINATPAPISHPTGPAAKNATFAIGLSQIVSKNSLTLSQLRYSNVPANISADTPIISQPIGVAAKTALKNPCAIAHPLVSAVAILIPAPTPVTVLWYNIRAAL